MLTFIKNKLRLVLEQRLNEARYSKERDLSQFEGIVKILKERHGNDPYYMGITDGQWVGNAFINIHGKISIQRSDLPANVARNRGDIMTEKANWIRIDGIQAGRGIEHPDTYSPKQSSAQTRYIPNTTDNTIQYDTVTIEIMGKPVQLQIPHAGSPASDAVIKIYLNYENEIKQLIKKNMEGYSPYVDDKSGAQARVSQYGDQYTQMKQSEKLKSNLETELNKAGISFDINKYFDDELSYTKSGTTIPKIRMTLSKIQRGIVKIQDLVRANHGRERIQRAIEELNLPILYNKRLRGVPNEFLQK